MVGVMSTLAEIEAAASALTREEREQLEAFLRELREKTEDEHLQEIYRRTGFHPFPKRCGPPATNELVQQIRDEEGI